MVVIEGENDQVGKCAELIKPYYLPKEMWFEILSRLSFKALFRSQIVCWMWRQITASIQLDFDRVPVCGLLIELSHRVKSKAHQFSYFCMRTKKRTNMIPKSSDHGFVVGSGHEKGLLAELFFDFRSVYLGSPCNPLRETSGLCIHEGLLLFTRLDGTCIVHNPATKEASYVPKSKIVERFGFKHHKGNEMKGIIINYLSFLGSQCFFMVVRFCTKLRIMEVFNGFTRVWSKCKLELDDALYQTSWCLRTYVAIRKERVISLFIQACINYGVAIKFKGRNNSKMVQYSFPLPQVLHSEVCINDRRIWECEKSLYFSSKTTTGLWIWKAVSTEIDTWQWNLLFEISNTGQLCKPVTFKHLQKHVLNADVGVSVIGFHSLASVVILFVCSSIFAYDLTNDTVEWIMDLHGQGGNVNSASVFPFQPCLSFFNAVKDRDKFNASRLRKRKSERKYESCPQKKQQSSNELEVVNA